MTTPKPITKPICYTTVKFELEDCEVFGKYNRAMRGIFEKGGGQITPDEPATFDISSVTFKGEDILPILNEKQIEDIEVQAIEAYEERNEYESEY